MPAKKKTKPAAPKCFRFDEETKHQLAALAEAMHRELGSTGAIEAAVVRFLIAKEYKNRRLK